MTAEQNFVEREGEGQANSTIPLFFNAGYNTKITGSIALFTIDNAPSFTRVYNVLRETSIYQANEKQGGQLALLPAPTSEREQVHDPRVPPFPAPKDLSKGKKGKRN